MMDDVRWAMGDERFDMYAFENQRRLLDFWKAGAALQFRRLTFWKIEAAF